MSKKNKEVAPSDYEKQQCMRAVEILSYSSILNLFQMDLVEALNKENRYKQLIKRDMRRADKLFDYIYGLCYRVFGGEDSPQGEGLGEVSYKLYKHILSKAKTRSSQEIYNIILTIRDRVLKLNSEQDKRYRFDVADRYKELDSLYRCLGYSFTPCPDAEITYTDIINTEIEDIK